MSSLRQMMVFSISCPSVTRLLSCVASMPGVVGAVGKDDAVAV